MPCRDILTVPRLRSRRSRPAAPWRNSAGRATLLLLSGLILSACSTTLAIAETDTAAATVRADPYAAHVAEASKRFGVPSAWIRAVMNQESAGDVRAVSSAGARGLMQIMPDTWQELRARWSLGRDPFDPRDNILAGTAYLRELHDRFGSPGFLAAYNAGPGRYEAYLSGRPLPAETRAYVAALAPLIGGETLTGSTPLPVATIAADTLPWRRAPLFADTAVRVALATPAQSDSTVTAAADSATVREVSAITPRSNGLFAVRSGAGGPK
ncbi:lytic transglycosylase domain-containing protein [Mesorhizobium sp. M2A.F.Ca.ET.042.01.1.1]|uniref:lytic transglycosylase domain-containing protein n=1 Tax=Mesorhizobium sp. M2A.F.Ca.ET.042.01.1.1 TaxID=2496745 RepID=UPI000FCA2EE9|nr:lytic transglycosylase domain-containing protein [Mesorhizobium sp. M2A.F.Ca.ET.042.01.1.1]RUX28582.1 lytic transglycosylase domain-containing protein [Mesorhizobium sp. M2A.F.Ca.ET.042.01.1.1]